MSEFEEAKDRITSYPLASIEDVWVEYDRSSDTLHILFGKEEAEESILVDDNIIINVSKGRIIGITITEFKRRYIES
ncbi:MAG: DUF2283 domain-containing protein [Acidilobaceae archaeon]|nr:DUF2283 domain-containing protein [Desulfurococcaceae archaeon]